MESIKLSQMNFQSAGLEGAGFVGWLRFGEVRSSTLCPRTGGVYVVTYGGGAPAIFPEVSCGGWFKEKDPSNSRAALGANWVDDAEVVYIGKADNLRRRIIQFADFGAGRPVGHWGGRLIWQLPSVSDLLIAWKETPDQIPLQFEADLVERFRDIYGKPPFANNPHKLGG